MRLFMQLELQYNAELIYRGEDACYNKCIRRSLIIKR